MEAFLHAIEFQLYGDHPVTIIENSGMGDLLDCESVAEGAWEIQYR